MNDTLETHPLPPFLPPDAKLLILGSFPPPKARWKMDFYYPNMQNDMWRLFGLVFFGDSSHFIAENGKTFREERLREFLAHKGIALSDAAYRVRRLQGNAADKFLQVSEAVDLAALLERIPQCHTVAVTGELALDTLLSLMPSETPKPKIGGCTATVFAGRTLHLYRLPSSSRAYPLPLAQKALPYAALFRQCGLL